ncbi:hypothetical protein CL653_03295 [bacterium]|nr:hypothetical protein [bacterium]|tara:strand:- start:595 stop:1041 length:447 start_codon:yes stop_codon:yes gene_type:complete
MSIKEFDKQIESLFKQAHEAGEEAAKRCKPTPMIVGRAKGFSNEIDFSQPTEIVDGGACGFAYVQFAKGQRKLFNSIKRLIEKYEYDHPGSRYHSYGHKDSYHGGWYFGPTGMASQTQSMEIKEAYCRAAAKVFNDAGFEAYMWSRMD